MPLASLSHASDLFPTYLLPSLPFKRRTSSIDSNACESSSISSSSTPFESYLSGHNSHLRCARCLTDLALTSQIISKGFTGRHGRAYLVAPSTKANVNTSDLETAKAKNKALPNLPNTFTHKPVPRQLVTGAHTVSDISCTQCGSNLGWKYVAAEEQGQRYKVGNFILETKKVCRSNLWENDEDMGCNSTRLPPTELTSRPEEVEFDSQDEDECDDLFQGLWTPQLAVKRRQSRVASKVDYD